MLDKALSGGCGVASGIVGEDLSMTMTAMNTDSEFGNRTGRAAEDEQLRTTVPMHGLTYTSTEEDAVEFFEGIAISENGIRSGRDRLR